MVFNIIDFSNYEVTKGGIVYNRYHKPVRRKWVGNHIHVRLNDTSKKAHTVRVDKLVYQTYVQNPPYNYELEHVDGNQANCRLENLKYISPKNKVKTERVDEISEDRVSKTLSQHSIKLTQNDEDLLPLGFVKQACQLEKRDWKLFKQDLEKCGVKEKRTSTSRLLSNLKLIEED